MSSFLILARRLLKVTLWNNIVQDNMSNFSSIKYFLTYTLVFEKMCAEDDESGVELVTQNDSSKKI
jgi:hypothetical protein